MNEFAIKLKQAKKAGFYCLLLLLSACASTPKQPDLLVENAEQAIAKSKRSPLSNLVKEELEKAEKKVLNAKQAIDMGNKNEAIWLAEQALSDAAYANAKIAAAVYKDLARNQEETLKKYQEIYQK
jgi:hypothetical protein